MHRLFALCLLCLPLALVAACPGSHEQGIIVNLQTDYVPSLEFDQVRVEVDGAMRREVGVGARDTYTRPRFITTYPSAPHGQRTITLSLLRGAREVARRTLLIPFTGNYLATVVITRNCASISCSVGESCFGARCVPDTCITGAEPACPMPLCTSDAMCTSATACAHGECVGGACLEVPTAGVCSASEACLPGSGCVPVETPDASIDAASVPTDAFITPPSFVLYRLPAAATSWSTVAPTGDFPSDIVEAAFTANDGTLRVLTRTEAFIMSATGVFSGRTSRDTLFPQLSGMSISAADRVGSTLTIFHGQYTTYTWGDTLAPVWVGTIAYVALPEAWRGTLAPALHSVHASYSAPDNAHGWAESSMAAPCGVTGAYTEIVSFDGVGPSAIQQATYSATCSAFVMRRDYGSALPFTYVGAPGNDGVDAISYADGLWVFTH